MINYAEQKGLPALKESKEENAMDRKLTGYPSIDKPWLKYFSKEATAVTLPEGSMYKYLRDCNQSEQDDIAIVYYGKKITYRQLLESIRKTAAAFSALGIKKGDVVPILLPNIPENIYALYALNYLGAVADMVDLRSQGDALVHYYNETNASVAVICDLFADATLEILNQTGLKTIIVASPFDSLPRPLKIMAKMKNHYRCPQQFIPWNQFFREEHEEVSSAGETDDIACLFHTSGTTGFPKGVMMTNRNANAMALQGIYSRLRFEHGKRMMNQVPPFLAFNIICSLHMPLALHMTMMLLPEYRPDKFSENIVKTKATACLAGPADWSNFLTNPKTKNKKIDLSNMINPLCGSDSLAKETREAINAKMKENGCTVEILEGYGMTEIGSAACCNLPGHVVDGSVGVPFPFNNFCIYDNDKKEELPYGKSGEICMAGPTVMKGYYNNPEETDKVLIRHADNILWLHSGDLGHMDENGNVFLEGRLKRLIVQFEGFKIPPAVLEETICRHPDVSACCVVGIPDKEHGFGQLPVAFVVLRENAELVEDELRQLCKKELAPKYQPYEYHVVSALPLTPNGKVDYRVLEKEAAR